jgi:signal transduction histidine kinase
VQSSDIRKAALIVKIAQEFQWQDRISDESFKLTVYNDPQVYSVLTSALNIVIAGEQVSVELSTDPEISGSSNLVYINNPSMALHSRLFAQLQGKGILIITANSADIVSTMINIYQAEGNFGFSVNRPNLESEGFEISEKLLELGGTELESATIYKEIIKNVGQQRQALDDLQTSLAQAKEQFEKEKAEQDILLRQLEQDIQAQEGQLQQTQTQLSQKQSELTAKNQKLAEQTRRLSESRNSLVQSEDLIRDAEQALFAKQEEIKQTENKLNSLADEIAFQKATLDEQRDTLSQQKATLSLQELTLSEQEDQLSFKDELLAVQQGRFYTMVVFISVIAAAMFFVMLLWVRNRRANAQLSSSLRKLEKAKNQLVESEKFAALGQLVAGVAHELNTPIGVSITSASAMTATVESFEAEIQSGKVKKSSLLKHLEQMKSAQELTLRNLTRAGNLIQSFKQVSADQSMSGDREIELYSYLEEILQTLDVTLKQQGIVWELKGENVKLSIDPCQFAQVVQNLVMNCQRHAFTDVKDPRIDIRLYSDSEGVYLTIKDNGIGMDKAIKDKIFEPFYTTKRGTGGTGLGMHIVYNLITQSFGGTISVDSSPGKGCSFLLKFPKTN